MGAKACIIFTTPPPTLISLWLPLFFPLVSGGQGADTGFIVISGFGADPVELNRRVDARFLPYSLFALPGYFCVFLPPGTGGQFFLQLVFMGS